jgi:hypothetical protein
LDRNRPGLEPDGLGLAELFLTDTCLRMHPTHARPLVAARRCTRPPRPVFVSEGDSEPLTNQDWPGDQAAGSSIRPLRITQTCSRRAISAGIASIASHATKGWA